MREDFRGGALVLVGPPSLGSKVQGVQGGSTVGAAPLPVYSQARQGAPPLGSPQVRPAAKLHIALPLVVEYTLSSEFGWLVVYLNL